MRRSARSQSYINAGSLQTLHQIHKKKCGAPDLVGREDGTQLAGSLQEKIIMLWSFRVSTDDLFYNNWPAF